MKHLIPLLLSALVVVSAQAAPAQEDVARAYITQGLAAASAGDTSLAFAEFERARERHGGTTFESSHKLVIDMGSMLVHM